MGNILSPIVNERSFVLWSLARLASLKSPYSVLNPLYVRAWEVRTGRLETAAMWHRIRDHFRATKRMPTENARVSRWKTPFDFPLNRHRPEKLIDVFATLWIDREKTHLFVIRYETPVDQIIEQILFSAISREICPTFLNIYIVFAKHAKIYLSDDLTSEYSPRCILLACSTKPLGFHKSNLTSSRTLPLSAKGPFSRAS